MSTKLAAERCPACTKDTPRVAGAELAALAKEIPQWAAPGDRELQREVRVPGFAQAAPFVNRVGAVAEAEGHHPDIALSWGKVGIKIWTHAVGGLTRNDFVLAAKIDELPR